jgi:beta-lactamase regulating signal transducer with metallopeptidase domain
VTTIEVAAWVASATLAKASVVAIGLILGVKIFARSASASSLALGMGPWALGLVILIGPLAPSLGTGFVSIPHGAIELVSVGPVSLSPVGVFVALWAGGVCFLLLRLLRDVLAARILVRAGVRTSPRAGELLARAARSIGVTRVPELRETSELATAALIGFRRPVLLLPVQAREWSDEELFGVLCHELEHARRSDWLMLMSERIVGAFFWINPLVHLMTRYAAGLREMAADDAALRAGTAAPVYAGRLIAVARDLHNVPRLASSVAFAEGGRVDERVKALFDRRDRRPSTRSSLLHAVTLSFPFVLALAAFEPWTCLP